MKTMALKILHTYSRSGWAGIREDRYNHRLSTFQWTVPHDVCIWYVDTQYIFWVHIVLIMYFCRHHISRKCIRVRYDLTTLKGQEHFGRGLSCVVTLPWCNSKGGQQVKHWLLHWLELKMYVLSEHNDKDKRAFISMLTTSLVAVCPWPCRSSIFAHGCDCAA